MSSNDTSAGLAGSGESGISPPATSMKTNPNYRTTPFENGYQFPPKHTWQQDTIIGLKAFWGFTCTWFGFAIVVYGLNVVAWGGMLFLLLCNASPAMCYPTCGDENSPAKVWLEISCQILTALFCVTAFGLIPWRFRDFWYLLQFRIQKDEVALRRLGGIHRGWFRLEGSQNLPANLGPSNVENEFFGHPESSVPFPLSKIPDPPLTGIRAPATPLWKLDFVIWMFVWNTFLQVVLCGLMWGFNRHNRPSWSTGLFVALGCLVAIFAGLMQFFEGKKIKGIEGVAVTPEDLEVLKKDREVGVVHYNNIKDEKPKEKKQKKMQGLIGGKKEKEHQAIQLEEDVMQSTVRQVVR